MWGTAVSVQQMVFGNKGDTSATGVAFSRDEVTGAPELFGRLPGRRPGRGRRVRRAQQCAMIARAGRRDAGRACGADGDPANARGALRRHAGHGVHHRGEGGSSCPRSATRSGRRPPSASPATPSTRACSTPAQAIRHDRRRSARRAATPHVRPGRRVTTCWRRAWSASPGAAKGEVVFTAPYAVAAAGRGPRRDPVRARTEADDVAGFHAARGILTSEGGKASHAALVARGMGRPAVVGADALSIDLRAAHDTVDGTVVNERATGSRSTARSATSRSPTCR